MSSASSVVRMHLFTMNTADTYVTLQLFSSCSGQNVTNGRQITNVEKLKRNKTGETKGKEACE